MRWRACGILLTDWTKSFAFGELLFLAQEK